MNMFIKSIAGIFGGGFKMPKIIKDPEERILQAARKRLLDSDLSSFSLRGVAADCGIAVGTIYNYFKNKESLMAAVMAQDWAKAREEAGRDLAEAPSLREGLVCICRKIRFFCLLYQVVWSSHPAGGDFSTRYRTRHELLLSQIREMIRGLYERFEMPCPENRRTLFAELIIAGALHPEIREEEIIEIII